MKVHRFVLLLVALLAACGADGGDAKPKPKPAAKPARAEKVRPAALPALGWYPADAKRLAETVDAFLTAAPEWKGEPVRALISPHAGHRFAGRMQGRVFRTVMGRKFDRVFILGVPHRARVRGVSIPDFTHYETPLGRIPVDREVADRLLAAGKPFYSEPGAHDTEHSVEILLPFLQRAVKDLVIVPMLVGVSADDANLVARALAGVVGENDLVVASSDDCHYGENYDYRPFPKDGHVEENLKKLDMGAVDRILALDLEGYSRYRDRTRITTCGFSSICVLLSLLPGDAKGTMTGYETSAAVTGDWSSVVSYVGIVFSGFSWGEKTSAPTELTAEEQKLALSLARRALVAYVREGKTLDVAAEKLPPRFDEKSGVFVTYTIDGALRGCIGYIFPERPLGAAIVDRAICSAVRDPRFRPVGPEEVDRIHIEISVLSVPRPVDSWKEIEIGKHGIVLKYDGRIRSVYLPQVAPEQGWGIEETLSHLSVKGGLPADAWRMPRAGFEVYTAQVFGE